MSNVDQLRRDVKWWTDEVASLQRKAGDAMQTLQQKQRELADAQRDEREEASRNKER